MDRDNETTVLALKKACFVSLHELFKYSIKKCRQLVTEVVHAHNDAQSMTYVP